MQNAFFLVCISSLRTIPFMSMKMISKDLTLIFMVHFSWRHFIKVRIGHFGFCFWVILKTKVSFTSHNFWHIHNKSCKISHISFTKSVSLKSNKSVKSTEQIYFLLFLTYKTLTATIKQNESQWLFNIKFFNHVVKWFSTYWFTSVANYCTEVSVKLFSSRPSYTSWLMLYCH
jgi:hypothetical protein